MDENAWRSASRCNLWTSKNEVWCACWPTTRATLAGTTRPLTSRAWVGPSANWRTSTQPTSLCTCDRCGPHRQERVQVPRRCAADLPRHRSIPGVLQCNRGDASGGSWGKALLCDARDGLQLVHGAHHQLCPPPLLLVDASSERANAAIPRQSHKDKALFLYPLQRFKKQDVRHGPPKTARFDSPQKSLSIGIDCTQAIRNV